MAAGTEEHQTLVGDDSFVSLYRRYRPGTFGALRGQPHVVRALQSAVRDDRVGHAYLFSGPRGTGKTSTARILAKALNCTNLDEGEPCGVCASCVEITKGTSLDVTELDAASNNGVDAMRDLVAHANLGTPGRWKVYIVDEVHMLSNAAANALLKTLEEPPSHVVFVLATTDPQKVPATIRSRTQHLEFRLLGSEVLEGLLRDVRAEAGLELDDAALSTAVRRAKGSARDALSALDQVAASGVGSDVTPELAAVVEGLCDDDATKVLVSLAELHEAGWGPQQLATELVGELREGFLSLLAPSLSEAAESDRRRIADQATRLGLARLVRAMETLGRAQVEMRDAPEPQVVLEVALVKVARADLEDSGAALSERVARLERKLAELSTTGVAVVTPPAASAGTQAPAPVTPPRGVQVPRGDATSSPTPTPLTPTAAPPPPSVASSEPAARPSLGALRRQRAAGAAPAEHPSTPSVEGAGIPTAPAAAPAPAQAPSPGPSPAAPVGTSSVPMLDGAQLTALWPEVLGSLPGKAKALLAAGRFVEVGTTVAFALPNAAHLAKAAEVLGQLRASLSTHHAGASTLELVVDPSGPAPAEPGRTLEEPTSGEDFEALEAEASDATNLGSLAETKILEAFPGAIEVTD